LSVVTTYVRHETVGIKNAKKIDAATKTFRLGNKLYKHAPIAKEAAANKRWRKNEKPFC